MAGGSPDCRQAVNIGGSGNMELNTWNVENMRAWDQSMFAWKYFMEPQPTCAHGVGSPNHPNRLSLNRLAAMCSWLK